MPYTVSVIVPVYNARAYLAYTLDALLQQSLDNIEILLLDDASTDGSGAYAQELAARYPDTVRYIPHAINMGTGVTRNQGLSLAKGEYIAFCDHDDLPMPHMLTLLYEAAQAQQADMVVGGYRILRYGEERMVPMPATERMVFGVQETIMFPVWNKLFRASFLRTHGIAFAQARTFEDAGFVCKVLAHNPRVAVVESPVYTHILRESSASYSLRLRAETLTGLEDLAAHLHTHGVYAMHKRQFLRIVLRHALYYPACLFFLDTLLHGRAWRDNLPYAPTYAWKTMKYLFSVICRR